MSATERFDALILGGGIAGITAALWLREFGLSALVLEESASPGGQLHEIHAPIRDYPLSGGDDGPRFAARVLDDARRAELSIRVGSPVTKVSTRGRWGECQGERFRARTLLIATGLKRRWLGVPGEQELLGRGVSHSANRDRDRYAGRPVVVVGGGTAAVEDALLCAEVGSPVTLIHRSTRYRARRDFLSRMKQDPRIRVIPNAEVTRILGEDRVEETHYRVKGSGITRFLKAAAVFVRIGWDPRTELFRGQIPLDRAGYIPVRLGGGTSAPGVFAAGDVCSPLWPSIANAAGQGAAAAWEIAMFLGRIRRR